MMPWISRWGVRGRRRGGARPVRGAKLGGARGHRHLGGRGLGKQPGIKSKDLSRYIGIIYGINQWYMMLYMIYVIYQYNIG